MKNVHLLRRVNAMVFSILILISSSQAWAQLEIRFYNSSTNAASNVYILPYAGSGSDFTWTNNGSNYSWTNFMASNGNQTVKLSDIGITGSNAANKPYYSIYTTNFNNAAWYVSYGGGDVSTNQALSVPSASANGSGNTWVGVQWSPFELTLDGNTADLADITTINSFSIPMVMRSRTNNGIGTNNSAYYQQTGWTNFNSNTFSTIVQNLTNDFPNAIQFTTNLATNIPVMIVGPNAAPIGSLIAIAGGQSNSYPLFTDYFNTIKTNTNNFPHTKIKDNIAVVGTNGTNYFFWYDFDFNVTASNTLKFVGFINVTTNEVEVSNSNPAAFYATNLTIEVSADSGTNSNNWASSFVYLAPTPANYTTYDGATTNYITYSNAFVLSDTTNGGNTNWIALATNTATFSGWGVPGPTNPPEVWELYNSDFGMKVVGRIMGDAAAGMAFGFVNSGVPNPYYGNTNFGNSPSGSWWGGNQYPSSDNQSKMFYEAQTNVYTSPITPYSLYAADIWAGTTLTYTHPIYDRMQYYKLVQIACDTNTVAPGDGIKVMEIEFYNGISSVSASPSPTPTPSPGKLAQTIAPFKSIPHLVKGSFVDFPIITPQASSGLPVTVTLSSGNAKLLRGGLLLVTAPGPVVLTATQPGNATYRAAQPVTVKFYAFPSAFRPPHYQKGIQIN